MKRSNRAIIIAAVVSAVLLIAVCGLTVAYLVDTEVKENVITIGRVSIDVTEGAYADTDIVAQSEVPKSPIITNTGTKDEFVFMKISVPKDSVTLLYESDVKDENDTVIHREGEIIEGMPKLTELFKLQTITSGTQISGENIDFSYHAGTDADPNDESVYKEGWVLLSDPREYTKSGEEYDAFIFGYNKRLHPKERTVTLFDKIRLKNFIDEEAVGSTDVLVFGYGIQADELGIPSVPEGTAQPTKEQLRQIFEIIKGKRVMSDEE